MIRTVLLLLLALAASARGADPAARAIREGNALYADGQYTDAINKYNEALVEQPAALEPKFNKANGYYRLDDLGEAIDLYQEVAAESKDMALVAKAKYNLGNCLFQRGSKQRDSDLQKALQDMEASITYWRGVLDIEPENQKAAENIEVARLTIKDILDQLKKQQEQQQQQGQQDQQDQQQQSQDQQQQGQQSEQEQSGSQQAPNQPQDPNEAQSGQPQQDPSESQGDRQREQEQAQEQQEQRQTQQAMVPDTTAREILDKEQRQKQERQIRQRGSMPRVEKDW
ncbi:MAG: tetratricopeptide repeat protein [Sedimentisphaerales bacterium]|nr:tetratricopeptide repeat protein [Sedimentisphaerales bacterium]